MSKRIASVVFWERNCLSVFPSHKSYLPVFISGTEKEMLDSVLPLLSGFEGNNYRFEFSESVHDNGWWCNATSVEGNKVTCKVTIHIEDGNA